MTKNKEQKTLKRLNTGSKTGGWVIFVFIIMFCSCKKEDSTLSPIIQATLSPISGQTTQTFIFDLSNSKSNTGKGSKVFTRWDWDGNGTWDTPYTRFLVYEHRYYSAGTWIPRLEMANLDGLSDTTSFTIPVLQGHSAPKPSLIVTPANGNFSTPFFFDASGTKDDEDSLDQLSFRWDFESDGLWDTEYQDSSKITHRYLESGQYTLLLQVKDPSGLTNSIASHIEVTSRDTGLVVSFQSIPDSIICNTTTLMDASASNDPNNPDKPLSYRWDWDNDRIWDTEWLTYPQTEHVFNKEFFHLVRLQVKSEQGLTNEIVKKIRVYHKNELPRAYFSVSTLAGNINTVFRFDCRSTRDAESAASEMFYRWDFDGDGNWDTEFECMVITMHQFNIPGTFHSLLQVKDLHGGLDSLSKTIHISTGTNSTGIITDKRGPRYEYYGTVLIGDQWWLTRNLCVQDTAKYCQFFYNSNWWNYYDYGNLYLHNYMNTNSLSDICPEGWRIPSSNDWNKLFSHYPEDRLYEALMPGGESDFSATLGGTGTGLTPGTSEYRGIDEYGYYWTTTKPIDLYATSLWIIKFDKSHQDVLKGYLDATQKQYSVRCVKDAN